MKATGRSVRYIPSANDRVVAPRWAADSWPKNDETRLPAGSEDFSHQTSTTDHKPMTAALEARGQRALQLLHHAPQTTLDLIAAGVSRPKMLIRELRSHGYCIETTFAIVGAGDGCTHLRVARYELIGAPVEREAEDSAIPITISQWWGDNRPACARDGTLVVDRQHDESMAALALWVGADAAKGVNAFDARFVALVTTPTGRTITGIGGLECVAAYLPNASSGCYSWEPPVTLLTDGQTRYRVGEIQRANSELVSRGQA